MAVAVRAWGDLACFTRPDAKVERMSYPVMTPPAAKGFLKSIFWKPEMKWLIDEIRILNPVEHIRLTRRELKGKTRTQGSLDRTLRQTYALRDVAYEIVARIQRVGDGKEYPLKKYTAQFERRVRKGQCFRDPYLGLREFPAAFGPPNGKETPIDETRPIGPMPLSMNWSESWENSEPPFEDSVDPTWFDAVVEDGVLHVPSEEGER
jgi:CRISPR-associated protein Cas5d